MINRSILVFVGHSSAVLCVPGLRRFVVRRSFHSEHDAMVVETSSAENTRFVFDCCIANSRLGTVQCLCFGVDLSRSGCSVVSGFQN